MNKFHQQAYLYCSCMLLALSCHATSGFSFNPDTEGLEIMRVVHQRHQQFPYIYEEQSMVMEDRNGVRDTRRLKRYSRMDEDGTVQLLLLFDYPEEVRGVAILANRNAQGEIKKFLYLPGFQEKLIESKGEGSNDHFLGTDFTVEDLTGERLEDYYYARTDDIEIEGVQYAVVDVHRKLDDDEKGIKLKTHFICRDNLFITMTQHYDSQGRVERLQTQHDLRAVDGDMWRSNMILIEDKRERHQSLIKIHRRIFSRDYVPAEVFTAEWLFANFPYIEPATEETDTFFFSAVQEIDMLGGQPND